jgi:hypothetical protein
MILRNHKRQFLSVLHIKIIPKGDTTMCRRHISYLPLANISYGHRPYFTSTRSVDISFKKDCLARL